ncbi:beta-phosphoglucomutase [Chitinophaga ginsengisoli]|uniref:Beta-phosphoglucomutase n=1 Tax=Chitinophaga ginsengisoli TaxID=363837 RepID=A0A2P8GLL8_9BACT|nr:beta-phosphoglucomutase [Chitinophaga ginsengisoli]PSL34856.1 beta-phosphoglucomutase [Chitinophaga ginsengisoli]
MQGIAACIFDLDGVIVDTAVYHFKAWKRLANELGFNFTEAQNEKLKGVSRVRSLELILGWGGIEKSAEEQQELATRKNEWYVDMIHHMTPEEILPGAKELLDSLRAAGIKTALGSASKNAGVILDKVGILPLFDAVIDGNMVSASKPDPEVFLKGAEALGVAPAQCIVFEDAIAGVQAGKAGGMKVVGIGEQSVLGEADLVVGGLQEINIQTLTNLFNSK